jgi:hypothetical protein
MKRESKGKTSKGEEGQSGEAIELYGMDLINNLTRSLHQLSLFPLLFGCPFPKAFSP